MRIIELRQYTLRPGRRDALIDLFDRELVETQEAEGMTILGQFRDLDRPDRFVWLRGFADMTARAQALGRFYGGPVWRAHGAEANATMVDSDDVLLLRPVATGSGLPAGDPRPAVGSVAAPSSLILVTLYFGDRPFDEAFVTLFDREVVPVLADAGAVPLARLWTEYAANTFPALPVREGEHVFAWCARFPDEAGLDAHTRRLERCDRWRRVGPALAARITGVPQRLRLAPTARSRLR